MNKIKLLTPSNTQVGGHYSSAATVGPFIFTAGHVPRDENRNVVGETITEQTIATLQNIQNTLKAANATLHDVVQVRVHLSDLSLAPGFNAAYAEFFGSHKPVRTVVGSQLNGVMIEVDVIAYQYVYG
ncbi:MAG: RidA family protein [Polaromonas sp.]|nr:RidA family protein [Polaromonas sp.]